MHDHDAVRTWMRGMAALRAMRAILEREGARNWLPGIVAAERALTPDDDDEVADAAASVSARLREAAFIYRAMTRGPGSFADYYVQRPDPAEQARANAEFGAVADELWAVFGDLR